MAKKRDSFYVDEEILIKFNEISKSTLISKNALISQVLKDFIEYFQNTGKVKREANN